ncbi:phosphatase domain-containing protein [Piscirickettsia salmonis]|uniref:phosphatase domain-containing protein n=1 Tax=Piscirickettsia salmonis TaxID=1238 RepID=UPI003F4FFFAF
MGIISDNIIKEEILDRLLSNNKHILFVIDDRRQVVDMWRRRGIVCLQCAEGNF